MPDREAQTATLLERIEDRSRPPLLMGILNVTPDSFYDGGHHPDPDAAVRRGLQMAAEGAELIDVGGESTRPGAGLVPVEVELRRVLPVIRALVLAGKAAVSIDTRHAAVAEAALEAGAVMVNDVSGFRHDPEMVYLLGRELPLAVAMHMRGSPADMQTRTEYRSLVAECIAELWAGALPALDAGLPDRHLLLDPGLGFAKDARQCVELLAALPALARLGRPLVVGPSRKSFLGRLTGHADPAERLFATAGAVAMAVAGGARVLRVHDVAAMRDVVVVAHAVVAAAGGAA